MATVSRVIGNHPRLTTFIQIAVGLQVFAVAGVQVMSAQTDDQPVRVMEVKRSSMQETISGLAAYDIAFAHLDPGMLIVQRGPEVSSRSYLFVEDLGTFVAKKALEPGHRLLPQTFSPGGKPYCAVFEKVEGDNQLREYAILTAPTPGDVEKKARTSLAGGFAPVAVSNTKAPGAAVIFERMPNVEWKLLSTRQIKTMQEELDSAASDGYRVVASGGGEELVYALVKPTGAQPIQYRLLSTTKSTTLERELNEAANEGWRLVPFSLAALAGGSGLSMFAGRTSNEAAVVVEKVPGSRPVSYKVVGARRMSTLEKEVIALASQGFSVAAAVVGYEETVIILASSGARIITEK